MLTLAPARLALTIAALILGAAATGCSRTERLAGNRILRVALSEYHLNPQSVSVSAGTLTLLVHNYGRLTHSLSVSQDGVAAGATKPIAPGQSAALVVTLNPGSYLISSTIQSDLALGQYGTLSVTS